MDTRLLDLLLPRDAVVAQLRLLELSIANYDLHVPLDVQRRYDVLLRELDLIESDAAISSPSSSWASTSPPPLVTLEQRFVIEPVIQRELASLEQTVQILSRDLPTLPVVLVSIARLQIDEAQSTVADLRAEWKTMHLLDQAADERVSHFVRQIDQTANKLHLLSLREIYTGNLHVIHQQQALLQHMPLLDHQRSALENSISLEQQEIQKVEALPDLDPSQESLLAIRHQNLRWYREMLAGQRPAVPVYLLSAQERAETKLQAIDTELMQASDVVRWRSGPTRHCS